MMPRIILVMALATIVGFGVAGVFADDTSATIGFIAGGAVFVVGMVIVVATLKPTARSEVSEGKDLMER